jgi:hypothetical protein
MKLKDYIYGALFAAAGGGALAILLQVEIYVLERAL